MYNIQFICPSFIPLKDIKILCPQMNYVFTHAMFSQIVISGLTLVKLAKHSIARRLRERNGKGGGGGGGEKHKSKIVICADFAEHLNLNLHKISRNIFVDSHFNRHEQERVVCLEKHFIRVYLFSPSTSLPHRHEKPLPPILQTLNHSYAKSLPAMSHFLVLPFCRSVTCLSCTVTSLYHSVSDNRMVSTQMQLRYWFSVSVCKTKDLN